jgi:hypothetical protein
MPSLRQVPDRTINLLSFLSGVGGAGIAGHPQVIENHADIACELPHFLSDAGYSLGLDDSDGETAESSDVFRPIARAYTASIFVLVPVCDVMAAILNAPMAAIVGKDVLCIGLLPAFAGDAMGELGGGGTGLFIDAVTFEDKSLCPVGEAQVVVELGGRPNLAGFNASVIRRRIVDVIGLLPVLEE